VREHRLNCLRFAGRFGASNEHDAELPSSRR
jgi:hypothetical protein